MSTYPAVVDGGVRYRETSAVGLAARCGWKSIAAPVTARNGAETLSLCGLAFLLRIPPLAMGKEGKSVCDHCTALLRNNQLVIPQPFKERPEGASLVK
jgi:hypothetical protein